MTPTRSEFLHFAPWEKALFYVLIAAAVATMAWQIWDRRRLWMQGRPVGWKQDRFGNLVRFVLGQKKVQGARPTHGAPMHLGLFYGFLTLLVGTTLLAINTYSEALLGIKFHQGAYYLVYETVLDVMGAVFVIAVIWAIGRRHLSRPKGASHASSDTYALLLLLLLGLTGFWLEAARMANDPQSFDSSAPIGYALSRWMGSVDVGLYKFVWWFHMAWVAAFFVLLPRMRIRHIVLALFSTAGTPPRAFGHLTPISMEEVEATGRIGVSEAKDYSRWHLLSTDACMECGRCTEACPAWNVGKVLNPKEVVQGVRRAMVSGEGIVDAVGVEALLDCTTCGACVEACPVNIRHLDLIVDARRSIVAEGGLSGTAATMLRQLSGTDSAWGQNRSDREAWMKGLEVPLCREGAAFDVLFWVGCAGATDPAAIRTTKAIARLLSKAGVRFACLGREEACTGDPARRLGDEFQFQEQAGKLVPLFEKYEVKTILTACPHCLNTFRHEYPDFGGRYEVIHHTQFLARLVEEGKLQASTAGNVTYHDPCYLARMNGESDAPRLLLGDRTNLNDDAAALVHWIQSEPGSPLRRVREPANHGRKTLCCGAGGGRMFMEEPREKRPGVRRANELIETGAATVAVGCPFCRIMLDASLGQASDAPPRLADVAELLSEANP
ncbi:MAG: 4Fe-4S dicluster domain-containing protein [Fimbriimonadaceae bacterium]|nr:4Fe-4S dicluster domain-containing protein [Fimbriimonadaceae bacterium]